MYACAVKIVLKIIESGSRKYFSLLLCTNFFKLLMMQLIIEFIIKMEQQVEMINDCGLLFLPQYSACYPCITKASLTPLLYSKATFIRTENKVTLESIKEN